LGDRTKYKFKNIGRQYFLSKPCSQKEVEVMLIVDNRTRDIWADRIATVDEVAVARYSKMSKTSQNNHRRPRYWLISFGRFSSLPLGRFPRTMPRVVVNLYSRVLQATLIYYTKYRRIPVRVAHQTGQGTNIFHNLKVAARWM
jgi:hypothetical protein